MHIGPKLAKFLTGFLVAWVTFARLFSCLVLCFFAYIPAAIAWSILSVAITRPSEITVPRMGGLCVSVLVLCFFLLLIYRALTGRGRKEDGGLLPPWAMNTFVAAFGAMAIIIIEVGIYSRQLLPVLGGVAYLFVALTTLKVRRNRSRRASLTA